MSEMSMDKTSKRDVSLQALVIWSLVAYAIITVVTMVLTGNLDRFKPLLPDQGSAWYYWKLPPDQVTLASRLSMWIGYAVHQIVVWVFWAKGRKTYAEAGRATKFNLWFTVVNILFVVLHLVQTQLFYDGLAQDVPIWSSQGSVIVMLVLVLFMRLPQRGLFFGKAFMPGPGLLTQVKRYHGIFISWAIVYTFWFHPMDGNWGLMSGFVYMFVLFMQMSLMNSDQHFKNGWVALMEFGVVFHGTLVTVYKEDIRDVWPMFLFGFFAMFVFTQQYEFKWNKYVRALMFVLYFGGIAGVYGFVRGFDQIYEIFFIPTALYGGALGLLLLSKLPQWFRRKPAGASA